MCPSELRFLLLFTFLRKNLTKKVMVFFSSCNSVKFHSELLNYIDIPVMDIHVGGVYAYTVQTCYVYYVRDFPLLWSAGAAALLSAALWLIKLLLLCVVIALMNHGGAGCTCSHNSVMLSSASTGIL